MVFSNVDQPLTLTHHHFILCGPDLTRMSPGPAHRRGSLGHGSALITVCFSSVLTMAVRSYTSQSIILRVSIQWD